MLKQSQALVKDCRIELQRQYEDIDDGFMSDEIEHPGMWKCMYCSELWEKQGHLNHDDDCSQGRILKLLDKLPKNSEEL